MLFCRYCGKQLLDDSKFCNGCGKSIDGSTRTEQRLSAFEGEIHKCPNCGEVLESFSSHCSACGYELRNAKASESIKEFTAKIEHATSEEQKITIIRNFPVPNTKEDILEFMILASTNIVNSANDNTTEAWQAKIEQTYQKAKLSFNSDAEFSKIQDLYEQASQKIRKKSNDNKINNVKSVLKELLPDIPSLILTAGWLISLFILIPLCGINLDNAGVNGYQILLNLDFIAGTIFIPLALRSSSNVPKAVAILGLLLSIIVIIPLCGKNLDNAGTNAYQIIMFFDIVCSVIILVRTLKHKKTDTDVAPAKLSKGTYVVVLVFLAVFLIVYGISCVTTSVSDTSNRKIIEAAAEESSSVTFEWPQKGLSEYLPKPETLYGELLTDDEGRINFDLYKVKADDFENYVKACKSKGYTINVTKDDNIFYAYDQEQHNLNIFYDKDESKIAVFLDAPNEMAEFKWPSSSIVSQIPKPQRLVGHIYYEKSDMFSVEIANISKEEYVDYVDSCLDEGFTNDYSRSDDCFSGDNSHGYSIRVKHDVFDVMYISISQKK